jgi:hypothetical protein
MPSGETQIDSWGGMERLKPPKKPTKELKLRIWGLLMKQLDFFEFSHRQAYVIVLAAGSDSSIIARGDWNDTGRHPYKVLVSLA